jgi:L-ascorbate metabolism protein UlaG (beta-lactamase superfamily)
MNFNLTHISTATMLLEIGNLRLLTNPMFDSAGGRYSFG